MKTKRLIFASTNQELLQDLIQPLRKFGYQVEVCRDGDEVLAKLEEGIPSAIISDLDLPKISGPELCWLIREQENWAWIPFVIVAATPDVELKLNCLRSGADDLISIPVTFRELLIRLEVLIKRFQRVAHAEHFATTAFIGELREFLLPDLIQWLYNHKKTGRLWVSRGYRRGSIYFDKGNIKHAVLEEKSGEEAIYEMLPWKSGRFEFEAGEVIHQVNVVKETFELLLEYSKQEDEQDLRTQKFIRQKYEKEI